MCSNYYIRISVTVHIAGSWKRCIRTMHLLTLSAVQFAVADNPESWAGNIYSCLHLFVRCHKTCSQYNIRVTVVIVDIAARSNADSKFVHLPVCFLRFQFHAERPEVEPCMRNFCWTDHLLNMLYPSHPNTVAIHITCGAYAPNWTGTCLIFSESICRCR